MIAVPRIARYFLVGGTAAVFDIGIFLILVRFGLAYQYAGVLSFIVATGVNYVLGKRYVFADRHGRGLRTVAAIYLASACGLLLNQIVLWVGIERLFVTPLFAKLAATGMVFFWNYGIRNYVIFRRAAHAHPEV